MAQKAWGHKAGGGPKNKVELSDHVARSRQIECVGVRRRCHAYGIRPLSFMVHVLCLIRGWHSPTVQLDPLGGGFANRNEVGCCSKLEGGCCSRRTYQKPCQLMKIRAAPTYSHGMPLWHRTYSDYMRDL